ncbi:unnamed protein product [Dovyalis caffra]|uniref:Uncharacterized protein n=1 Tax=Dovyalis caffra TaxID=77055 RepID=A0AAV1SBE2_9ROSI|nr:unnamed protein product [Dovyalis caffra]
MKDYEGNRVRDRDKTEEPKKSENLKIMGTSIGHVPEATYMLSFCNRTLSSLNWLTLACYATWQVGGVYEEARCPRNRQNLNRVPTFLQILMQRMLTSLGLLSKNGLTASVSYPQYVKRITNKKVTPGT